MFFSKINIIFECSVYLEEITEVFIKISSMNISIRRYCYFVFHPTTRSKGDRKKDMTVS